MNDEKPVSKKSKQLIGVMITFNGQKNNCHDCNRSHTRSFIVHDVDEARNLNQVQYFGSGCIQKQGFKNLEIARTLAKVSVQTTRLSSEVLRGVVEA